MIARLDCSIWTPAGVRWIFLPSCSNSGNPACSSSLRTCVETAGCVRCSSSAAREKLRLRATASKTLSWRRVAFFIVPLTITLGLWKQSNTLTVIYRSSRLQLHQHGAATRLPAADQKEYAMLAAPEHEILDDPETEAH